jgi:hypothetical protein
MEENACLALCGTCIQFDRCIKAAAHNDNEPARYANDNEAGGLIILPSNARLLKPYVIHRIAIASRHFFPISRHKLPMRLTDIIWAYDGLILDHRCERVEQLDIDVWEEISVETDPGIRWFSGIDRWYDHPPILAPHHTQARRLRTLFLAISILSPNVGRRLL